MNRPVRDWLCGLGTGFAIGVGLACGGGWATADSASSLDAVNLELQIEELVGDGGTCTAGQVRALERAAYCANASMLARHGATLPEGGPVIRCTP